MASRNFFWCFFPLFSGAASGLNPAKTESTSARGFFARILCRFENKLNFFSNAIGSKLFYEVSVVPTTILSCHGTANTPSITCFVSLMRDRLARMIYQIQDESLD
jgi:hypothetical protein